MNSQLPVPVPAYRLALPASASSATPDRSGRAAHRRRPTLERVSCLSYGGGMLAAGGGMVCCVWDTRTDELVARLTLPAPVAAVWVASSGRLVAIAAGREVAVHDLPTGVLRHTYKHEAEVTSVHIGNGTSVGASSDTGGRIQVHDLAAGRLVRCFDTPPGRPIVFVHRGQHALVNSDTHSAIIDVATGATMRRFPYDNLEPLDLGTRLPGTTLVACSGSILRWFNCAQHAYAHCVRDLGSRILSIDIDDVHGLTLAATEAGGLHLFGLHSGAPHARYQSFTVPLTFARFGADASLYAAGGEALVMHLVEGRHVRSYYDESPPFVAMALATDDTSAGGSVLLSDRDGGLASVSLRDGRRSPAQRLHRGSVSVVTRFGERAASGAYDGVVRVFDAATLQPQAAVELGQGPVQAIAADVQAGRLWIGTWCGKVNEVDLDTGAVLYAVEAFPSSVRTLAIDPRSPLLFAGGDDGELRVYERHAGALRPVAAGLQPGAAYRAVFDEQGSLLVTAGDGLRRYRAADLTPCDPYPGRIVRWFDRAAGRIVVLGLRGELTLFDEATHAVQHHIVIDSPYNHRSVAFASAQRILTASADGLLRVFDERLQAVATLELLRDGLLWSTTPRHDGHPGWLHTDRPELLDVGARGSDGRLQPWDAADPRRVRHLATWTSPSHVMRVVRGDPAPPAPVDRLAGISTIAPIGRRLGWTR